MFQTQRIQWIDNTTGLVMTGCLVLDALFHDASLPIKLSDFFIAWFMYLLGYTLQSSLPSWV